MNSQFVVAVDPGNTYHGVVSAEVWDGGIQISAVEEVLDRVEVATMVEAASPDALVIEEYRLFPWQARNQGFSDFPTPRAIGMLEYAAIRNDIPVYFQKAADKKRARALAKAADWPMTDRELGSGKGKYRGPDFDPAWLKRDFGVKSSQHVRDALCHLVWYAWTNPKSPAFRLG